jgi:ATP-dependent helicase/nuclease subunit A
MTPAQLAPFSWSYANIPATNAPAKTSASALRRLGDERDEETAPLQPAHAMPGLSEGASQSSGLDAAGVGTAHHKFLQHVNLIEVGSETGLHAEANRMTSAGILTLEEAEALDVPAILGFWQSALGAEILQQDAPALRRELPFTAAFSPGEISGFYPTFPAIPDEFVVVQGSVDLAVILAGEIWIVDFKTDRIRPDELTSRTKEHAPQLQLYSAALERIYHRPVSRIILYFLHLGRSLDLQNQKKPAFTLNPLLN